MCGIITSMENFIVVKGAKENNLKNVSVKFPRDRLVVFTGVSGSGKSTLAFKTIFAEGQRRYIESLSSYARMFLGQAQKPDVESIDGLSPAISIDQKTTNHNPRSTVGTVTEIYDYFRLLFSRIGKPICPNCNKEIQKQSVDQIVEQIAKMEQGTKIYIEAPVVRGKKGTYEKLIEGFKKSGYARICIDGTVYSLDENFELDKNKKHNISVVVDRLAIKEGIESRLAESVETALNLADGLVVITEAESLTQRLYSTNYACPYCGWTVGEITPRMFSFNNPYGACPNCTGLGFTEDIDENLVLKNSHLSIKQGAFNMSGWSGTSGTMASMYFNMLAKTYGIDLNVPVKDFTKRTFGHNSLWQSRRKSHHGNAIKSF